MRPSGGTTRGVGGHHGQQDDPLVQDLVVLQVVQQCRRRALRVARHEHGGARDAMWRVAGDHGQELVQRVELLEEARGEQGPTLLPRRQRDVEQHADHQREPAALGNLRGVGAEECQFDHQEDPRQRAGRPAADAPRAAGDEVRQHRRDHHRRRHRDAVGGGERARAAKPSTSPTVAIISAQFTCGM